MAFYCYFLWLYCAIHLNFLLSPPAIIPESGETHKRTEMISIQNFANLSFKQT
jgi:hypothetical protein